MIVFNTMTLQMDAKAFAQSRFAEPRDLLIIFLILTNDSNEEIVSKKKKIWKLATAINPLNLATRINFQIDWLDQGYFRKSLQKVLSNRKF